MKKTQIILASLGGLALLGALIVGWMLFDAFSVKAELLEDLDMQEMKARKLVGAKIAPTRAALRQIETNRLELANWVEVTRAVVSAGDRAVDAGLSEAAFKSKMIEDARLLSGLPGGVAGKLVKENFGFGYTDFITGGKMPTTAELSELQIRWSDIVTFVNLLGAAGANELLEVSALSPEAPKTEESPARAGRRSPPRAKKKAEASASPITQRPYMFKFRASPVSLVRVLNACAANKRFMIVNAVSFARPSDEIASRIGESKKETQENAGRRRRNRRRASFAEEAAKEGTESPRKGLVTDPATTEPFVVTLRIATVDFGTKSRPAVEEASK